MCLQVYIEAKNPLKPECAVVRPGDRLGLFLEEAPAAVAYTFDINVEQVLGEAPRTLFPCRADAHLIALEHLSLMHTRSTGCFGLNPDQARTAQSSPARSGVRQPTHLARKTPMHVG